MVACEAGVDALGFNFAFEAKKRNRYIDPEEAMTIAEKLPPFVASVAVCVNAPVDAILRYAEFVDYVQLHGEEDPMEAAALGAKAIKAFRLNVELTDKEIHSYESAGAWLVDAYKPDARGGTGETTDWARARKLCKLNKPIILAGGLTPENVAEAITQVRPYAVDTAGGVESEPGKKDHERIRLFIDNAKRASLS